jgi:hypothetical protein
MKKTFVIAAVFVQLAVDGVVLDTGQRLGVGVESGVNSRLKKIEAYAFATSRTLKFILILSSVEMLGDYCFSDCTSLVSAHFGKNSRLSFIGEGVFDGCKSLKKILIPNRVTTLGDHCFSDCTGLGSVHFRENPQISIINDSAFDGCRSLKILNFGLTPIKADYFAAANLSGGNPELEPTDIPEGVEEFYKRRFPCVVINPESVFVPTGMKFFRTIGGGTIRVDNSTLGVGFVMVRRDQAGLKAFRIRN